jgi:3-methylfumaryl-CoA hydratase
VDNTVALQIDSLQVGDSLPQRKFKPDNVQLFLYNAVLFNAHRIHFDAPYATEVEGYPGLVTAGPLIGDWLNQCIEEWLGDSGRLTSIDYSNRIAACIGETLYSGGKVVALNAATGEITLEVFVKNERDEIIAPGHATAVVNNSPEISSAGAAR